MADCGQWGEAKKLWQNTKNVFTMTMTTKDFKKRSLIASKWNEDVKNGHILWLEAVQLNILF